MVYRSWHSHTTLIQCKRTKPWIRNMSTSHRPPDPFRACFFFNLLPMSDVQIIHYQELRRSYIDISSKRKPPCLFGNGITELNLCIDICRVQRTWLIQHRDCNAVIPVPCQFVVDVMHSAKCEFLLTFGLWYKTINFHRGARYTSIAETVLGHTVSSELSTTTQCYQMGWIVTSQPCLHAPKLKKLLPVWNKQIPDVIDRTWKYTFQHIVAKTK